MNYNSQKEQLIMPEYGRTVQELIKHAKTLENDEDRQKFMERIVELMLQMNPHSKNLMEYREKLWKHAFKIAEYDLKVVPPNGKIPEPEDDMLKPQTLPYPQELRGFRHYGMNVRTMIQKAIEIEDKEKRDAYTFVIASYMKLAYQTWSTDHFISDKMVREDLQTLSEGKLSIDEEISLNALLASAASKDSKKRKNHQRKGPQNKKGGSRHKNNRMRKRR